MKKRILSLVLSMMLSLLLTLPASAATLSEIDTITEDLGDGYTLETVLEEEIPLFMPMSSTKTKTASSTIVLKKGSTTFWSYKLTGTFTYNGKTSKCTSVKGTPKVNSKNWSITSSSATKSGNTANGKVTAKEKVLGITIDTITKTNKIKCSKNGNISY